MGRRNRNGRPRNAPRGAASNPRAPRAPPAFDAHDNVSRLPEELLQLIVDLVDDRPTLLALRRVSRAFRARADEARAWRAWAACADVPLADGRPWEEFVRRSRADGHTAFVAHQAASALSAASLAGDMSELVPMSAYTLFAPVANAGDGAEEEIAVLLPCGRCFRTRFVRPPGTSGGPPPFSCTPARNEPDRPLAAPEALADPGSGRTLLCLAGSVGRAVLASRMHPDTVCRSAGSRRDHELWTEMAHRWVHEAISFHASFPNDPARDRTAWPPNDLEPEPEPVLRLTIYLHEAACYVWSGGQFDVHLVVRFPLSLPRDACLRWAAAHDRRASAVLCGEELSLTHSVHAKLVTVYLHGRDDDAEAIAVYLDDLVVRTNRAFEPDYSDRATALFERAMTTARDGSTPDAFGAGGDPAEAPVGFVEEAVFTFAMDGARGDGVDTPDRDRRACVWAADERIADPGLVVVTVRLGDAGPHAAYTPRERYAEPEFAAAVAFREIKRTLRCVDGLVEESVAALRSSAGPYPKDAYLAAAPGLAPCLAHLRSALAWLLDQ